MWHFCAHLTAVKRVQDATVDLNLVEDPLGNCADS